MELCTIIDRRKQVANMDESIGVVYKLMDSKPNLSDDSKIGSPHHGKGLE